MIIFFVFEYFSTFTRTLGYMFIIVLIVQKKQYIYFYNIGRCSRFRYFVLLTVNHLLFKCKLFKF